MSSFINSKVWKAIVDIAIMFLTALSSYLGASAGVLS